MYSKAAARSGSLNLDLNVQTFRARWVDSANVRWASARICNIYVAIMDVLRGLIGMT